MPRTCADPGCNRPVHAKGLCQKHYDAMRKSSAGKRQKACSVPGCNGEHHAQGFCQKHYDQRRKKTRKVPCRVPTCNDEAYMAGYCHRHYEQLRRGPLRSLAGGGPKATGQDCSIPGCKNAHHAKGYCKSHYSRLRRKGELSSESVPVCAYPGCTRPAVRVGKCRVHLREPALDFEGRPSKSERLQLIRQRHEVMKSEIESIREDLETEEGS